jgi:hypothetical protein
MRLYWVSPLTSGRPLSRESLPGFGPIRHDCEQPRGHPPNVSILPLPRHLKIEVWRCRECNTRLIVEESVRFTVHSSQSECTWYLDQWLMALYARLRSTTSAMDFATEAASVSVGASTITRMSGSVPDGRTRMRPEDPSLSS